MNAHRLIFRRRSDEDYRMRYRLRHSLALVGLVAVGGCSDLFGLRGPEITVSVDVQPGVGTAFVLRSDIGGRRVELTADTVPGRRASTNVHGDRYGTVPVHVTLLTVMGDSVTAVSFSEDFQHGHQHWVAALIGPQRPLGICTGAVVAAPLTVGSSDTLFVMYGSIPHGALC
jgi:hypothetical protein